MPVKTLLLAFTLSCCCPVFAGLIEKEVDYQDDKVTLRGFLVYDDAIKKKRPGVLVVHEWWGHNDYARERARKLARLGYTALALDMYGKGVLAKHPKEAGKFSGAFSSNRKLMVSRFNAAYRLLTSQPSVDTARIAAIGYCFGGNVVLQMAIQNLPLAGVASFHGSIPDPAQVKGRVKPRIAIYHGADDPFVDTAKVKAFEKALNTAGAKVRVRIYKGAKHSFTNPGADKLGKQFKLPLVYNRAADQSSWKDLTEFLKQVF